MPSESRANANAPKNFVVFSTSIVNVPASGDVTPRRSSHVDRVHGVGDYRAAKPEVVVGHCIRRTIAGIVQRHDQDARVANRLFDRVDPHVNGAKAPRKHPRDCRLPGSRQAGQYDKHVSRTDPVQVSAYIRA